MNIGLYVLEGIWITNSLLITAILGSLIGSRPWRR